jgi:hypothetical protein
MPKLSNVVAKKARVVAKKVRVVEEKAKAPNRYSLLIAQIFERHYSVGVEQFEFERDELAVVALELNISLPKNIGDVIYSFRYRLPLPPSIKSTETGMKEWIIEGAGVSKYRFKLTELNRIEPRKNLVTLKVPDSTPEIINAYALGDEQALLAKVRYNRLVDLFLGITAYSLQSHLRTTVKNVGQIEIDEIYVGIDRRGRQFVVPVQAKGGNDKHGSVQTQQDIDFCAQKFPQLICRPISAQFMSDQRIAMFELAVSGTQIEVAEERHYLLVQASEITSADLQDYAQRSD